MASPTKTMSPRASERGELSKRIESLGTKQKMKLLERVLTPAMELRLAMEQLARRSRHVPRRVLDRAADSAIQVERLLRRINRLTEEQQRELLEAMLLRQRRAEPGGGPNKRIKSTAPAIPGSILAARRASGHPEPRALMRRRAQP
jgi:hypothetical protein